MQDMFGIAMDTSEVVELDSSSPTKFSRHLIIPLPGVAFANNSHVGALVGGLLTQARESEDGRRLFLNKVCSLAYSHTGDCTSQH